jgi:hypothetical protein
MRGDFSRETYDRIRHFSRVLQQQGRVQVDADWNEQTEVLLHYLRTLAADLIGPFAGPAGDGLGFEIKGADPDRPSALAIGRGRYYVDGILCENEAPAEYATQPDHPTPLELKTSGTYLLYLDVWERHITTLEDDRIRDAALGGPDTTSRAKIVWQVKADDGAVAFPTPFTADGVRKNWEKWVHRWQPAHAGCLRARVNRPEDTTDPCLTAPDAKYRGNENQFYRVEVHKGGSASEATFKWSRDNGAIVSRVTLSGSDLIADSPRGFSAGHWIELTNDHEELRGRPGTLVRAIKVEGDKITLESSVSRPSSVPEEEEWPTLARRWDHRKIGTAALKDGAVPVKESKDETGWIDLEDGIQIHFLPSPDASAGNVYRSGDYWTFPARVATGDIEWPKLAGSTKPAPRSPRGIRHHYAPLAILKPAAAGWTITDCRCEFPSLNACKLPSAGEDGIGGVLSCEAPAP